MSEQYRFFGSGEGDTREYNQSEFAEVFKRFLRNGYIPDVDSGLQVTETDPESMAVLVGTGEGYIEGYWYKNDEAKTLNISPAHSTLNRIDRVVLRLDVVSDRVIVAEIKQGTNASNPVPPSLTRTAQTYEISLAQIYVAAGVTSIDNVNITDERDDFAVCGQAIPYHAGDKLSKNLDANNKKITNLANPSANQEAATKKYVDDRINTRVPNSDVSNTAEANKLIKTNEQGKLPIDITGDANTLDNKHASDFVLRAERLTPWTVGNNLLFKQTSDGAGGKGTEYEKVWELKLTNSGALRVTFTLRKETYAETPAYARIYVNGTPKGVERSTESSTPVSFTEDITGIQAGDLLQIYAKSEHNVRTAYVNTVILRIGNPTDVIEATVFKN